MVRVAPTGKTNDLSLRCLSDDDDDDDAEEDEDEGRETNQCLFFH